MIKKLTPASITSQKKWAGFATPTKKGLVKKLKDTDKDNVPDKYDCKPSNRRRQEAFLPADADYLNNASDVKIGRLIGSGLCGDVHAVTGNSRLVAKVPRFFLNKDKHRQGVHEACNNLGWKREDIEEEANSYRNLNLNDAPLFIPTKIITKTHKVDGLPYTVLVRPKVRPLTNKNQYDEPTVDQRVAKKFTDKKLEEIRQHLITLSKRGISLDDGLQIGIDSAGRPLIYDAGRLYKYAPGHAYAYQTNNDVWLELLVVLDKYENSNGKYGEVEP
jgi:hypothetical protein